jgi:hypothetical protein
MTDEYQRGAQVLQMTWEAFATDLFLIERAPKAQHEKKVLDAGTRFAGIMLKLGFSEPQADMYRTLYVESLRNYLQYPAHERGALQ